MKLLGKAKDLRTQTTVLYVQLPVKEYLEIIGNDFDQFTIQRKREKHKVYSRMKNDIKKGALLPTITLAVKPSHVDNILRKIEIEEECIKELSKSGRVDILDGLQRTYILKDLSDAGEDFKENYNLLVEFWLEKDEKHLIYRLLVLNAGQKPMSSRHQVEILFSLIKDSLEIKIPGLKLFTEKDMKRRTHPCEFHFDRIASGYQCFLNKTPEITRENIVAEQIQEDLILIESEDEIKEDYDLFVKYLDLFCKLDKAIFEFYNNYSETSTKNWCGDSTVIQSYFAAIGRTTSMKDREKRCEIALKRLIDKIKNSDIEEDPLGLKTLEEVKKGINPRKSNVGSETRRLIFKSFQEFFREEGELDLSEIWTMEA